MKTIKPDHDYEIRRPRRAISGTYSYPNPLKAYKFSHYISEHLSLVGDKEAWKSYMKNKKPFITPHAQSLEYIQKHINDISQHC